MTSLELKSIMEQHGLRNIEDDTCIRITNKEIAFFNCGVAPLEDFEVCIGDISFYVFEECCFEWDENNLERAAKTITDYIERSEEITPKETYNVDLVMTDTLTGETVERSIDKVNAYSNGSVCWELRGEDEQRKNLEDWIRDRGNEQHETILKLESWSFS